MAGSKRGKQSKSKQKSKAKRSDAINRELERSNSELELAQSSNNFHGGFEDNDPQFYFNSYETSCLTARTEDEIVPLLYKKLIDSYNEVKDWLLKIGCSERDIERAFLVYGHIHGLGVPLVNILINSINFLENNVKPIREGFKSLDELYGTMLEVLIDLATQLHPNIPKAEAMWRLYVRDWGSVPSNTAFRLRCSDQNTSDNLIHDTSVLDSSSSMERAQSENNDLSLKKGRIWERTNQTPEIVSLLERNVPMIADSIRLEIGAFGESIEGSDRVSYDFLASSTSCSNEECLNELLECNSADPEIVDLVKTIRELQDMVEDRKKWACQKVIDSAKKLSKDTLELKLLRMEMDNNHRGNKEETVEKPHMQKLVEMERSLRDIRFEAESIAATIRKQEREEAQMRADIEASKLNASELDGKLKTVLKRERRWMKKLAEFEKQKNHLQAQCDEENQRLLQLQKELLQAEKEAEEAEPKWRHAVKEREQIVSCLSEETRKVAIQKASSRARLLELRQKLETHRLLAGDERIRLEEELSRLQLSQQMGDLSVGDDDSLYNSPEALSFIASASYESSQETFSHRKCMICSRYEVSVVFLPCAHQVVCRNCHEDNGKSIGGRCPYCQVGIGQCIVAYGPSS